MTRPYLVGAGDEAARDPALVGAKAASLADLAAAGFAVPEFVVLTTHAFAAGAFRPREVRQGGGPGPALPPEVEALLGRATAAFAGAALAVRSSGVDEDLEGSSFAGQFESVLNVRGPEALAAAIRRCWASAGSAPVVDYRRRRGFEGGASLAVVVQRQVAADAAGVVFSADPVSGDRGTSVVNAVRGLADRMVAGEVTPEEWRVRGDGPRRSPGGAPVLTEAQAARIADLARALEAHAGCPQDVEWALEGSTLWVLQSRPVTGLPAPAPAGEPVPVAVDPPRGFWERDLSHFPDPVSPLQRSLLYPHARRATPQLLEEFGMLAERIEIRDIGGWHYIGIVPLGGGGGRTPPWWLAWVMARLHPRLRRRLAAARDAVRTDKAGWFVDRWYGDWMPQLNRRIDELRAVSVAELTDADLGRHLDAVVALKEEGIRVHVLVIGAHIVGVHGLALATRELLGWDDARTLTLLAGLSGRSTEPARGLAELGALAGSRAAVRALVEAGDGAAVDELDAVDPEFAAAFQRYRHAFGHRILSRDLTSPTLAERPELLLRLVANQLATGYDPAAADEANRVRREAAEADARGQLAGRPSADCDRFEWALARAQRAYAMREENVFFTVFAPDGLTRYAALEVGRRLVEAGRLDAADDVFFLEYEELRTAFDGGGDARSTVERRRGERAWVLSHPGPPSYGEPPPGRPSLRFLPREARMTMEALLWSDELDGGRPAPASAAGAVRGTPASGGRASGPVRVIRSEGEFAKLRPGDVVVCPITSPTWSVLFPSMAALVTDSGGILNHPAIIAREYGIPAVVATGNATALLRDGQRVIVDGGTGVVELEA